eukprot:symbB.v1.2.002356.t1/scaffold110.1/size325157/3
MEDPFDCSLMTLDLTTECPKIKSEKLSGRVDAWDLGEEEMIDGSRKARPSSWWRPWKKDERPEVSQVIEIPSSGGPLGAKLYDLGGDCMTPISLDEGGRCETPVGCIGRPLPRVLQVPVAEIVAPGAIPSPVNSEAKAVSVSVGPYGGGTGITSKPFSLDPDGRQEQRAIEVA